LLNGVKEGDYRFSLAGTRAGEGEFGGGGVPAGWWQGTLPFWIHHESMDTYYLLKCVYL